MEKTNNILSIEEKIKEFWITDIWKCNPKHIHNTHIKFVLCEIQNLTNQMKPNKKIFLLNDGEFKIKNDNKIENNISKLKNDNINYIKTHADCIPEYHNLIITHKKNSLFVAHNLVII